MSEHGKQLPIAAHRAYIVDADEQHLVEAAERIKAGKLVAFPTETVYGLGASCTNEAAVRSIFEAKGRPLNDPVIAHVPDIQSSYPYIVLSNDIDKQSFDYLASSLWPGPITFVIRANYDVVPRVVTADSGWVGIRCPNHPIALKFLELSGVAVCAPSANRFGHVSPTSVHHVMDDLGDSDIMILDGGKTAVGIESTVAKLDFDMKRVVVLRRGGVSQTTLSVLMSKRLDLFQDFELVVLDRSVAHTVAVEAPGQLITHYAPDVPSYLAVMSLGGGDSGDRLSIPIDKCIVIDFGGMLSSLSSKCRAYRDLSVRGDPREAAHSVFDVLRWTETVGEQGLYVLVADTHMHSINTNVSGGEDADVLGAVHDRLFRACSGRKVSVSGDIIYKRC